MNEAVNLTNCDREPIHIPGSVQPFGFLLTLLSDFTICMASDNAGSFLGADIPDLLQRPFPKGFYTPFAVEKYALCFNCHEQQLVLTAKTTNLTNFRDGDENLHFLHVNRDTKGRSCKTCHDLHASDQPKHIATSVAFEGSKWPMELTYAATDDGGTCAPGCHKPRTYSRSHPATRPATTQPSLTMTGGTP